MNSVGMDRDWGRRVGTAAIAILQKLHNREVNPLQFGPGSPILIRRSELRDGLVALVLDCGRFGSDGEMVAIAMADLEDAGNDWVSLVESRIEKIFRAANEAEADEESETVAGSFSAARLDHLNMVRQCLDERPRGFLAMVNETARQAVNGFLAANDEASLDAVHKIFFASELGLINVLRLWLDELKTVAEDAFRDQCIAQFDRLLVKATEAFELASRRVAVIASSDGGDKLPEPFRSLKADVDRHAANLSALSSANGGNRIVPAGELKIQSPSVGAFDFVKFEVGRRESIRSRALAYGVDLIGMTIRNPQTERDWAIAIEYFLYDRLEHRIKHQRQDRSFDQTVWLLLAAQPCPRAVVLMVRIGAVDVNLHFKTAELAESPCWTDLVEREIERVAKERNPVLSERRLKVFYLPERSLARALLLGRFDDLPFEFASLPGNAKIVRMFHSHERAAIGLWVEHPSFAVVDHGATIPVATAMTNMRSEAQQMNRFEPPVISTASAP